MISVEKLYNRLNTLTTTGTSGYFSEDDFNSNLYSVQYAILALLCDNYENNQKVTDSLINHTKEYTGVTLGGGVMFADSVEEIIEDYYRTLAVNYVVVDVIYPSIKINVNEKGMYLTSQIRKPNLVKGRTLFYFTDRVPKMLPAEAGLDYNLIYACKPTEAKIAFTTQSDDNNDYLVIDSANTVDIDFPEGLFNLFTYYMLESIGIEQKEQLMQEYSQLGIERTTFTDVTN